MLRFAQIKIMNDNGVLPTSAPGNPYGPLTAGQMFERAARLLRENFKLFFGIVLVVIGVEIVVGGVLGGSGIWLSRAAAASPRARLLFLAPLSLLAGMLLYIFAQIIQGALFLATQARLKNLPVSVGEACGLAAEKAGRLIGISLLVALRIFGYLLLSYFVVGILALLVALLIGGVSDLAGHLQMHAGHLQLFRGGVLAGLLILAMFALYVAAILWLIVRYSIAIPAALAENLSITEAIRRSIQLTGGAKGRLYALFLAVAAVWIAFLAVTLPVQLLAAHATGRHLVSPVWTTMLVVFLAVCRILVGGMTTAFIGVATALCYYDLRARKEGFGAPMVAPVVETLSTMLPVFPDSAIPASSFSGEPIPDGPIEDLPIS